MGTMIIFIPEIAEECTESRLVRELGNRIGFGRLMQLAQQEWRRTTEFPGSEFAYGPCVSGTVVCGCVSYNQAPTCDWCNGSGWLTKKVREVQIQMEGK